MHIQCAVVHSAALPQLLLLPLILFLFMLFILFYTMCCCIVVEKFIYSTLLRQALNTVEVLFPCRQRTCAVVQWLVDRFSSPCAQLLQRKARSISFKFVSQIDPATQWCGDINNCRNSELSSVACYCLINVCGA